jgi:hypothetical protein
MKINYSQQTYIVNNREGFDLTTALRLWKTKYADDYRDFQKEVITHESLNDFDLFVQECWSKIKPVTVEEALKVENAEERRTYFDCIGIEKLFKSLNPKLLDKQTIKKKRTRWDDKFEEYTHEFEDIYELYEIEGKKLFDKDRWGNDPQPIYAVRCWCTTTNREYWLYVPKDAALGRQWWLSDEAPENKPDAIRAIAWTVRVSITDPEKIYRQGDIIVVKESRTSVETNPYHLTKEQYLSLMTSET